MVKAAEDMVVDIAHCYVWDFRKTYVFVTIFVTFKKVRVLAQRPWRQTLVQEGYPHMD